MRSYFIKMLYYDFKTNATMEKSCRISEIKTHQTCIEILKIRSFQTVFLFLFFFSQMAAIYRFKVFCASFICFSFRDQRERESLKAPIYLKLNLLSLVISISHRNLVSKNLALNITQQIFRFDYIAAENQKKVGYTQNG